MEKLNEVNIQVYSLAPTQSHGDDNEENIPEIGATLLCRTHHQYTSSLYLNLYKNHLLCIKDLARYSKSFYCSRCGKYWKRASNLRQDVKGQDLWRQSAAQVFRAAYHVPMTVFEELEEECIIVPGTSTPLSLQSHIWFWALLR